MKKIKSYKQFNESDFTNEELNWKTLLPTIALASSLNLSSCKTKNDFENKIPDIETLVDDHIYRENAFIKDSRERAKAQGIIIPEDSPQGIEFKKIISVEGPYNECHRSYGRINFSHTFTDGSIHIDKIPYNTYYIIVNVEETYGGKKLNSYFVDVYQENKNGKGLFINSSVMCTSPKELKVLIDNMKKYDRWNRYSWTSQKILGYGDYMDELNNVEGDLTYMKDMFLDGFVDSYGGLTYVSGGQGTKGEDYQSASELNKPSDYFIVIDVNMNKLNNIKEESKNDLESNNISKQEYDKIMKQVEDLSSQLQEFKFSI